MPYEKIDKEFAIGGNANLDATASISSDAQEITRSYEVSFQFVKSGTNGNPIVTIEVSNDNVNWNNPYLDTDGVTPITFELANTSTIAFDQLIPFRYVRVSSVANGTTTGTYTATMTLTLDN